MGKRILAVIDMQEDFVRGALAAEKGESIVEGVVQRILTFDGDVVYTMDTHNEGYSGTQEGRNLPVPHCIKGSAGWKMESSVQAALEERGAICFEKPSFGAPDMVTALVKRNEREPLEEIVLIGICTDICVLTNAMALKCFLPEVPIRVEAPLCAGVNEERHKCALAAMEYCQIKTE